MIDKIDLHGRVVSEAKMELDRQLSMMTNGELVVIHGYSSSILKDFVRKQYRHKKIKKKILTTNPGETIFVL